MPFHVMPVMEVDGKRFDQSIAICRLIAKRVGLSGTTDLEDFEIDSIVYTINDLSNSNVKYFSGKFKF